MVQTISMLGALILVAIKGTMEINGVGELFSAALKTERIEPPKLVSVTANCNRSVLWNPTADSNSG